MQMWPQGPRWRVLCFFYWGTSCKSHIHSSLPLYVSLRLFPYYPFRSINWRRSCITDKYELCDWNEPNAPLPWDMRGSSFPQGTDLVRIEFDTRDSLWKDLCENTSKHIRGLSTLSLSPKQTGVREHLHCSSTTGFLQDW